MLTEAITLAVIGIVFVFLFLGVLVFAVKGMSAVSLRLCKAETQVQTSHEPMQAQRQAALVAACTHHHKQ